MPDGKLTAAGQTTKLTQVYAYLKKDFFHEKKEDTVVLLTGRAITDIQLRDGFALSRLVDEGKLSFVQQTINAPGHRAFKMPASGASTEHRSQGKVDTRGLQKDFGGTKYESAASFRVRVQPTN